MKSKKFFYALMTVVLSVFCLAFTACGDDDEKDEPKPEDKFTTEYRFEVEFTSDLLATADVKAYVLSPEGIVSEETITKTDNVWGFKGNSIPDNAGVMFEFDAKQGDFTGSYKIGYECKTTVKCLNHEEFVSYKSKDSEHNFTVPAEKLAQFYGTYLTIGGKVNAKGEASTDSSDLDFGLNQTFPRPPFGSGGNL